MTSRDDLIGSIVSTIADYREGDIPARSGSDVDQWVRQFSDQAQDGILAEMSHVLQKTYLSRKRVIGFLRGVMKTANLVGDDPASFWKDANLLDIQGGGASQREMLALFRTMLQSDLGIENSGSADNPVYVYLDDGIFTGNRALNDIRQWINGAAPPNARLHVIASAVHRGGEYYASRKVTAAAQAAGKAGITVKWWHAVHLEDRKIATDTSDVLRPTAIPDDEIVLAYVAGMAYQPHLRKGESVGAGGIFSSGASRHMLEQEFLKAGAKIRSMCPNLGITQRPLGHMTLETLGFGSTIVTFRNCPNNAPLALWAGDPWFPLFPRSTNNATAMKRLLENLAKDFV